MEEFKTIISYILAIAGTLVTILGTNLLSRLNKRLDDHDEQIAKRVSREEFVSFKLENAKQIAEVKRDITTRLDRMENNIIGIITRNDGK